MISFLILLILAIITITVSVIAISVGGTIGFVLFGDIIVCVILIVMIIKKIIDRRG